MARTTVRAMALASLLLAAVSALASDEESVGDPEVTACRQQCARQRQFGAAERRHCLRQCDEYGRAKRQQEEEEREGAERERDRCLHECRAGPPKTGCERRCREAYERTIHGGPREVAAVAAGRPDGFSAVN